MSTRSTSKPAQLRAFVSISLFAAFLPMLFTGVLLFADATEKGFWGLSKHQWETLHFNSAFMMVLAGAVHLLLNWKLFWNYLCGKATQLSVYHWETILAVAIVVVVLVGGVLRIPPLHYLLEAHEWFEHHPW